jgi:hypothetical protein
MRLAAVVFAGTVLMVVLTGCSAHHGTAPQASTRPHHPKVTASAVLTGYAAPCDGALRIGDVPISVRVTVRQDGRVVATKTVRYGPDRDLDWYRFAVPPGIYTIGASRSPDPARTISVTAGQVRTVNFPNYCA